MKPGLDHQSDMLGIRGRQRSAPLVLDDFDHFPITHAAEAFPRDFGPDRISAVRGGKRRYLVALSLLFTAAGLLIPFVQSLAAVIALITIAVSAAHVGPAANGALVGDLLRSPGDAGRAFAFLVLGGNAFGLLAPIVTGYVVAATGGFNAAFVVAGALRWSGRWRLWCWRAARSVSTCGHLARDHVSPTKNDSSYHDRVLRLSMISSANHNPLIGLARGKFPEFLKIGRC
jgi:hypothetical protein